MGGKKLQQKNDICVLIPAYNEARTITDVIRRAKKYARKVLVVDDGSDDDTAARAEAAGAEVLHHFCNAGKGAALQDGFEYVVKQGYPVVIVLDGDGQHEPEEIPTFLEAAEADRAAIVVGNRMTHVANMPAVRYYTNWVTSAIISGLIKQRVPDSQCGFRLIRREVLEQVNYTTRNYDTESEILIEAARRGFKISSVPVKSIYSGQASKIKPVKDTGRFIRLVLRSFFIRRTRNVEKTNT